MKVKCFACDTEIDGGDSESCQTAFLAHGLQSHRWTYPEQALRTYAQNYAEAVDRLTGSTDRLSSIGEIAIYPVTEDRIDGWLEFFDHRAFAGNPDWASCYCLEPNVPSSPEQPERPWRDTRAIVIDRLRAGSTFGYLAYVGGQAAGWVNASLRSDYGLFRGVDPEGPPPGSVIGVSCFVIAPPFRRHGVAAALLDRVIADAPARGAKWIEGYPFKAPEPNDAGHFRGPQSMYDARNFQPVEVREREIVVRRPVG